MDRERTSRFPQDDETEVQLLRGPGFSCRYAYARAADSRSSGDPGQDYLVLRHNDRSFAFALCDGVSQSFYGNLAARLLGEALLDWLWDHATAAEDRQALERSLALMLKSLTGPATEQVQQHALPVGLADMLRSVLEDKRARGSESTFTCGRIDLRPTRPVVATGARPAGLDGRFEAAAVGARRGAKRRAGRAV